MQALVNEPTALYGQSTTASFDAEFMPSARYSSSIYLSNDSRFPDHIAAMFQKLNRLAALPKAWDSYRAEAPSPVALDEARSFIIHNYMLDLPFYFLAPGVNGEVMIEFQKGTKAAELYFLPDGQCELILFKDDEVEREGDLENNLRELIDFFSK